MMPRIQIFSREKKIMIMIIVNNVIEAPIVKLRGSKEKVILLFPGGR